ncbi:hypothetical protein JKP88DRAFT_224894 [Tribonema minus]|uniref:Secreted protein n=1 Tax=Tribonema minus TaxID=303371 RepID=A0A836CA86_9STRA|nr:hypothetical protein JKP88DRAFT_224894 [Tribonema minus]
MTMSSWQWVCSPPVHCLLVFGHALATMTMPMDTWRLSVCCRKCILSVVTQPYICTGQIFYTQATASSPRPSPVHGADSATDPFTTDKKASL